jgi:hypothetical protein
MMKTLRDRSTCTQAVLLATAGSKIDGPIQLALEERVSLLPEITRVL